MSVLRKHSMYCDCGVRHEQLCGHCEQPYSGDFYEHRRTNCNAALSIIRQKAERMGFDLIPRGWSDE